MLGTIAISLGITAVAAVYDVHRTLQFIGTFAVLATIGTVPVRYDNYQVFLSLPSPWLFSTVFISTFISGQGGAGNQSLTGKCPQLLYQASLSVLKFGQKVLPLFSLCAILPFPGSVPKTAW